MRGAIRVAALALTLATTACVRTAASIVTAPVRVAGWTADKLTTSQSEADRNYGRKMRKQEEREGREARKRAKEQARDEHRQGG